MPFLSGRVSYTRFRVVGDAPASVDDVFLSVLSEHIFREGPVTSPDQVDTGFTTGIHLLDTEFTYDKCGFGNCAHFAMRIDTHRVPADLKKAFRVQQEQAASALSPTGYASKSEKREAHEAADDMLRREIADGKFRRSKMIPILWDLEEEVLYCAAPSQQITEHLVRMMRESFSIRLDPLTSGARAIELGRKNNISDSVLEDLRPSPFTEPPPRASMGEDASSEDLTTPPMPWIAQSGNLLDFIGNELFYWLLWQASQQTPINSSLGDLHCTPCGNLDLACAWGAGGKASFRHDTTNPMAMPEAKRALTSGKWPRKAGWMLADDEYGFEFSWQAEHGFVSAGKLPEAKDTTSVRETQDFRVDALRRMVRFSDAVLESFIKLRTSSEWPATQKQISEWISKK